jgi:hypothetical protein
MTGNFTDGEIQRSIAADFSSRSNVSQTFAQLKARQQIQDCKHNRQQLSHRARSSGLVKGFRKQTGQCGESLKPYTRDSTSE